jgi:lipopolysaccharide transport system permease protein
MNKTDTHQEWDIVIRPTSGAFSINMHEIWRYKDLILLFVKRDFVAQYKQTVLGPVWHFIQPILTTVMFLLVFTRIAKLPTDGIHPVLFYMSGITLWNYFSVSLISTSNTFISNANIFGKVYFPRIVMPIATIISNQIRFSVQFLLLLLTIIWFAFNGHPIHLSLTWLLIPVLLLIVSGMALGIGIIVSSLTTKYRDLTVLLAFGVQLLMYATPIAYSLGYVKTLEYGFIINFNPLTPIVEMFRYCLFGVGTFTVYQVFYSVCFMVIVLFVGIILFSKVEKSFADTV